MARVVRSLWLYKRPHQFGHHPRLQRPFPNPEFDYEKMGALPDDYPERLDSPPLMWAVWLKPKPKEPITQRTRRPRDPHPIVERDLSLIFGDERSPLRIRIVKNVPYYNDILWRVKRLVDVRPVSFPDGEPTEADVGRLRVGYDGCCRIGADVWQPTSATCVEKGEAISDEFERTRLDVRTVQRRLTRSWNRATTLNEDHVWSNPARSKVE